MTRNRTRATVAVAAMGMAAGLLAGCGSDTAGGRTTITIWTQQADPTAMKAQRQVSDWIEKQLPVRINLVRKPGAAAGDNTALIAAVRGNVSPDLMLTDRFGVPQQAAIGTLRSMTPYIKKDIAAGKGDVTKKYLPFAIGEGSYNGQQYALPYDTDDRALIYNKKVLRDAGVDLSIFDPANGPMTVDQMMAAAMKINKKDSRGNYTRMGVVPWDDQGSPTTWALANGAKFFDNKTCQVTVGEPAMTYTLKRLAQWGKMLDYTKVDLFLNTYRPPNAPPTMSPMYQDRLGMTISGNWNISSYKQYAPKMDYGVTYLPVGKKGDKPWTWAGGFAITMPKASKHPDLAWQVMKLYDSEYGQGVFMKATTHLPTYESLLKDKSVIKGQEFFAQQLSFAQSRVPLPVGGFLWDALDTAQQAILLGDSTPAQAQKTVQDRMKAQMAIYCPFTAKIAGPAGAIG